MLEVVCQNTQLKLGTWKKDITQDVMPKNFFFIKPIKKRLIIQIPVNSEANAIKL